MKNIKDKKDYLILLAGFLGALKVFLASVGIDIITQDMIDSVVNMIGFGFGLFAIWKNTYVSKKGKQQKEILEKNGMK